MKIIPKENNSEILSNGFDNYEEKKDKDRNDDLIWLQQEAAQEPVSDEVYFIVPDKCTECKGFHEEPQCAAVCPVDCCVPDDKHVESEETLLGKQRFMHPEE